MIIFLKNIKKILKKYIFKFVFNKYGTLSFKLFNKTLNDANIEFFPCFGTLLGFIRDKGVIKHDYDFDFAIINFTNENWKLIHKTLIDKGFNFLHFFILNNEITEMSYSSPYSKHIKFDIFNYYKTSSGYTSYIYGKLKEIKYKNKCDMSVLETKFSDFDGLINYRVYDEMIKIPKKYIYMLEEGYGKTWNIPDPNFNYMTAPNRILKKELIGRILYEKSLPF